jgi:hypothetical protein
MIYFVRELFKRYSFESLGLYFVLVFLSFFFSKIYMMGISNFFDRSICFSYNAVIYFGMEFFKRYSFESLGLYFVLTVGFLALC